MSRIKARLSVLSVMALSALLPLQLAVFASELRRWLREQQFKTPAQMYRSQVDAVIAARTEVLMRRWLRHQYGIVPRRTF